MITDENKTVPPAETKTDEIPVDTTPVEGTTTPVVIAETTDTEIEPEEKPVKQTVYTVSAKLYKHEKDFIDKVLEARQSTVATGKPLTRDMNHFIRQCIRFTVNHRKNAAFWLPGNIDEVVIDT